MHAIRDVKSADPLTAQKFLRGCAFRIDTSLVLSEERSFDDRMEQSTRASESLLEQSFSWLHRQLNLKTQE